MENLHPSLSAQVSLEEWELTPPSVQRAIAALFGSLLGNTEALSDRHIVQCLNAAPTGIAIHNAAGQVIYSNAIAQMLLGLDLLDPRNPADSLDPTTPPSLYPRSVLYGDRPHPHITLYQTNTGTPYAAQRLPIRRALAGETVRVDDIECHRVGQASVALEVWAAPVQNQQGQVLFAIAIVQDISPRKRSEQEQQIIKKTLLNSESRYRQVIQAQTDLILRSLPDTTITFANEALCFALGQPVESVIGLTWDSFVPPEELSEIYRKIAALTPAQPTFENINRDYRSDGHIGWTQWINRGIFGDRGQLIEIQSVGRDITALQEKIQREQALNRVFQVIRNSLELDTIFATATAETAQLFPGLNCFVVQYLPQQNLWRHVAEFRHHDRLPNTLGLEIPDAGNPFAAQLKQLQIVRVEDTTQLGDAVNREVAQTLPGAWLLIPLTVEGQLWGSFTITTTQHPFRWSDDQVALVQAVAEQLEVAIQQANLYRQMQLELVERSRIEAALRDSETRFQNMAANVPGAIFRYLLRSDGTDSVLYMSPGCDQLWEVEAEAVVEDASILWQMIHPDDQLAMYESVMESARTLNPWSCTWRIRPRSGREKWLEAAGRPTRQANGDIIWDTLILDVSDRKHSAEAMRESERRYRLLAENINDLVCLHDLNGRYLYVSPSCEALLGYRYDELLGQDPYQFAHPDDRDRLQNESRIAAIAGKSTPVTYRMRQKTGHYIWFETLFKPIVNAAGQIIQLQTTSRDVTDRVQAQEQLRHDALHDTLTGLPNRYLLMERLDLAIHRAQRRGQYRYAVLFLDLDRFKVVNDSLGHLAGDQLLIAIAQTLQATLRPTDLAVRLGGDEFVILLEEIDGVQAAVRVTERIFAALQTPLTVDGREVYTPSSIGIVLGAASYTQASQLLRDADIAMYRAKARGKGRYEIFDAEMHAQALQRLHLENDLRRAIASREFILHYQPTVALDTGQLVGFEALIRWQHPSQGLKQPSEFIAVAEEIGLITAIDTWALHTACQQLAAWKATFPHLSGLKMNVNLSVHDLRRPDLLVEIDRVLAQTGLTGRGLTLEITESMLIDDIESTICLLSQLKQRNIQVSIDDFGTGYSSLSYLHQLPVTGLKVDRSFVNQIQT
ncbi:MAG TPA: EAL domain-containing protein, partial [Chroococcidiopsis sp.]